MLKNSNPLSLPRKRESIIASKHGIPASAGMTRNDLCGVFHQTVRTKTSSRGDVDCSRGPRRPDLSSLLILGNFCSPIGKPVWRAILSAGAEIKIPPARLVMMRCRLDTLKFIQKNHEKRKGTSTFRSGKRKRDYRKDLEVGGGIRSKFPKDRSKNYSIYSYPLD
jgi:hypothetical protein